MVDFFDTWYSSIYNTNSLLTKIRYYSIKRFCIRVLANICIPLFFKISTKKKLNNNQGLRIIVSLTTFPDRIHKIWIVIESILRQEYQPSAIILWLSNEQFQSLDNLPSSLLKLQARGLEIRLVDGDLKSHKKYYYFLQQNKKDYLVTIDDDIIYPKTLIGNLVKYHCKYPSAICCHRAKLILKEDGRILPYSRWPEIRKESGPCKDIFQTSGGGTLYPPGALHPEVLNKDVFTKICFFADDIWLNCMSQMNNTVIVKTDYYSDCLPLLFWKTKHLSTMNVDNHGNDVQLEAVRAYYKKCKNIDPFSGFLLGRNASN